MPSARLRVQTSRWLETRRRQAQGRETSWLSVGGSQPLSSSAFPVNKSRPAGREPVEMVNELLGLLTDLCASSSLAHSSARMCVASDDSIDVAY